MMVRVIVTLGVLLEKAVEEIIILIIIRDTFIRTTIYQNH
jgi:hypothetical protein